MDDVEMYNMYNTVHEHCEKAGHGGAVRGSRKTHSEKTGNRNFLREFWDKNLLRFNKQERKLIYWFDFFERRHNLFVGKYDWISTVVTAALFSCFLLVCFIPLRYVLVFVVLKRFRKGYKDGAHARANRNIVVAALKVEAKRWNPKKAGFIETWTRNTAMRDVFNVIRTVNLRDWVHKKKTF